MTSLGGRVGGREKKEDRKGDVERKRGDGGKRGLGRSGGDGRREHR